MGERERERQGSSKKGIEMVVKEFGKLYDIYDGILHKAFRFYSLARQLETEVEIESEMHIKNYYIRNLGQWQKL